MKRFLRLLKPNSSYKGSTLIEMVVSFTLLAIFVSTAALIISNVTTLYYHVRGESYARQVGDIVTQKISSQIEGSKYSEINADLNCCIFKESELSAQDSKHEKISGNSIAFYDRTDTRIRIFADEDEGIVKIYYYPIVDETNSANNRKGTYWTFDKKVYNGYKITRLDFAAANSTLNETLASQYKISDVDKNQYPSNIMVVYMTLKSEKYGEYNICRFIELYNYPEDVDSIAEKASEN